MISFILQKEELQFQTLMQSQFYSRAFKRFLFWQHTLFHEYLFNRCKKLGQVKLGLIGIGIEIETGLV